MKPLWWHCMSAFMNMNNAMHKQIFYSMQFNCYTSHNLLSLNLFATMDGLL